MKFAVFTEVLAGQPLSAQCDLIAAAGCEGVETIIFPETRLEKWQQEFSQTSRQAGLQPVVVILGGGLDLHLPRQMGWVREALPAIAETGAAAMLTPEYRAQDPLPLFPPYPAPPAAEQVQVDRALNEIGQIATRPGLRVYFEPVTQFESRFWRDVETVLAVCQRLANPQVGLCLDFHNMNITEASPAASIRRAGPWVKHIHLADSNRRLPGQGHLDFRAGLAALREIAYHGWYTFECGVTGDFCEQVRTTIDWLKRLEATA